MFMRFILYFAFFKHQYDLVVQPFDGGPLFIKIVRFPFYPSYEIQGGVFLYVPLQLTIAWFSLKIICYSLNNFIDKIHKFLRKLVRVELSTKI